MSEQKISFKIDGLNLSGVLHHPETPPIALIVGVHGLMADKNSPKQIALAERANALKMAYLRFDHRGCGESEGVFDEQTTLENRRSDLFAAIQAAQNIVGNKIPIGLFGSSLGGTICLTAAKQVTPFAMVTLAAPVQSRSIEHPNDSPESLRNEIVGNRLRFNIKDKIDTIDHILIIHGSADETVPTNNADTIYHLSNQPKKLIVLENGDHRISQPLHQQQFLDAATNWFSSCYRKEFM
jgi:alpha-beta hydrolase superfamily lysophospholipase